MVGATHLNNLSRYEYILPSKLSFIYCLFDYHGFCYLTIIESAHVAPGVFVLLAPLAPLWTLHKLLAPLPTLYELLAPLPVSPRCLAQLPMSLCCSRCSRYLYIIVSTFEPPL